jgi:hypothetical protein
MLTERLDRDPDAVAGADREQASYIAGAAIDVAGALGGSMNYLPSLMSDLVAREPAGAEKRV